MLPRFYRLLWWGITATLVNDNYWLLQATFLKVFSRPIPFAKIQPQHKQHPVADSSRGGKQKGFQSKSRDRIVENSQNEKKHK